MSRTTRVILVAVLAVGLFVAMIACEGENGLAVTLTTESGATTIETPTVDATVSVTSTGECYHRAGCRYPNDSAKAITLEEAKAQGLSPVLGL